METSFIKPDWPAPAHIKAFTSLRMGGVSTAPFAQFNLAQHVGDDEGHVRTNREILQQKLNLPADPIWIEQVHGTQVIKAIPPNKNRTADASYCDQPNQICAILTADCLPILLCNQQGTQVAAIHAGWRGLANGIIEAMLDTLRLEGDQVLAWLGPAIGPANFEVGPEVRNQFLKTNPEAAFAFAPSVRPDHWLADLYALARLRLLKQGISSIYGGNFCTYADAKRFYSYRRDGAKTGRMATLIWISEGYKVT